jgi:membrane-associated protein
LGQFEWVGDHIDLIIIFIVLLSVTPMIIEYLRHRGQNKNPSSAAPVEPPTSGIDVP